MPGKNRREPTKRRRLAETKDFRALHAELAAKYGVVGSYIGQKQIRGRYGRAVNLVCFVRRKKEAQKLSRPETIPKRVPYRGGRGKTIATDVIERRGGIRLQTGFNPGDRLSGRRSDGRETTATIGAFGLHAQHGPVFVTAGHFAVEAGGRAAPVQLTDLAGSPPSGATGAVIDFRVSDGIDYALVRLLAAGASVGNAPLTAIYDPVLQSDIGQPLFVLARSTAIPTVCRGLNMIYTDPATGAVHTHLIVTDAVTEGGDSGAALVDSDFRLWGLLLGTVRFGSGGISQAVSVFMPVVRMLCVENLTIGDAL